MLDGVQKQNINKEILDDLMMKTECRTINKHGITFLNMHYRSEAIIGIRDKVNIRYSLFDLSKIHVYSTKGEFLCVAHRVQKVHPMARVLGTVKDMEEYKQQYKKQQQFKNKLIKQVKKTFSKEEIQLLEIEKEPTLEIEQFDEKPKKEKKKTPREQQMNKPIFSSNYRKYGCYVDRDYSNIISGKVWVSDHAQIDVACLGPDGNVVFPWVTAWRDYKSGKWLGWLLACGSPNSDRIFQAFYYAAEAFGLPELLYEIDGIMKINKN